VRGGRANSRLRGRGGVDEGIPQQLVGGAPAGGQEAPGGGGAGGGGAEADAGADLGGGGGGLGCKEGQGGQGLIGWWEY